ncbi:hypothetical protein [Gottfriedia luciferensis]|uniref:hypothetical protein n=1 Tax=Gottfriedia luciferensis TaxID=178774 RepID=UPI000B44918B|nr:hypothetical protein [Gottfriedia luciferensis]
MTKWIRVCILMLFINLVGCTNSGMEGAKPPETKVQIGNKTFKTKLGSYCWNSNGHGECADTAGPVELLKGEQPIQVQPGEMVTLKTIYSLKPTEIRVTQISEQNETKVVGEKNRFSAPSSKGIYYYSYSLDWRDKNDKNVSNGDANYAFVLQVK